LLVLVVAQFVLAGYAFIYADKLAEIGQKGFEKLWEDSVKRPDDLNTLKAIHGIQRGLQCCGRTGPSDWANRPFPFPESCCKEDVTTCTVQTAFDTGCEEVLGEVVVLSGLLIAWIAMMFALFEVRTLFNFLRCRSFNIFLHSLLVSSSLAVWQTPSETVEDKTLETTSCHIVNTNEI
jgi:hypothetical protein